MKRMNTIIAVSAILLVASLGVAAMTTTTPASAYRFNLESYTGTVNRGELMNALDLSSSELNAIDTNQLEFVWVVQDTLTWQCQTEDGIVSEEQRAHRSTVAQTINFEVNKNPQGHIIGVDLTSKGNKNYGVEDGHSPLNCPEPLVLVEGSERTERTDTGSLQVRLRNLPGAWHPI